MWAEHEECLPNRFSLLTLPLLLRQTLTLMLNMRAKMSSRTTRMRCTNKLLVAPVLTFATRVDNLHCWYVMMNM
jgi:hypothetical protein